MKRKNGILFVISGPSGVGKGTVKGDLLGKTDDIYASISATTRNPRDGEIDGKDYFFISQLQFEGMIREDKFLEWAQVYTNMYGTPRDFVMDNLENGRDVLLEIDIQGALQLKDRMPEGVFIFLAPPDLKELGRRLCNRGKDSKASINMRLAACEKEMAHIKHYNYVVINNQLDEAVDKVQAIIKAERCKINNLDLG